MNDELLAKLKVEVPAEDSASLGEKMLLYWLIRETKPLNVLETGTHRGLATLFMAAALKDNAEGDQIGAGHITTYDPYEYGQLGNFSKFPELYPFITYKQERGDKMTEEQIDFAFIDGYHGYLDVIQEIDVLLPRLAAQAIVVFHDCWYEEEGVQNGTAVNDAIKDAGLDTMWLPTRNAIRVYSKHPEKMTGPLRR